MQPKPTIEAAPIPQQPAPDVNAMLVEALQAAEKLEHEALVALSEATYELKVGNTYTTATDTYKANNDLIHRLDKILNSQYRDRKRAALTAAKQAQSATVTRDELLTALRDNTLTTDQRSAIYSAMLAAKQAQPERAPTLDDMVSRFLCWRLPDNFAPDCHIKFDKDAASDFPTTWPTGTNLLDAAQARAMLAHVVGFDKP